MLEYLLYLSLKIEPIFYKIIYMSIIATFVGIAILIIREILKKQISPTWISRIWFVFIICLIIPIQIKSPISIYNYIPISEDSINYSLDEFIKYERISFSKNSAKEILEKMEVSADVETKTEFPNVITENESSDIISNSYRIRQFIPIIWGLIVITAIFAYILTYIAFEFKIRKYKSKNEKIELILKKCKEELKIKSKIKLIKQDIIEMPALFGIFNMRILVNDNILNLSDKEIRYVFMHELCHYKRKDNILNILITMLRVVYFFNPIIWISLNVIKNDLELATDEFAMKNENKESQKEYSKTLVKLSVINSDKFLIQTLCVTDNKKNLERRIDSIKKIEKFKGKRNIICLTSIVIAIGLIIIFGTKGDKSLEQRDIIELYNKVQSIDNISYQIKNVSYDADGIENILVENSYMKGNEYVRYTSDSNSLITSEYVNFYNKEQMIIYHKEKEILKKNIIEKHDIYDLLAYKYDFYRDDSNYNYTYVGEEIINNIECYKFKYKQMLPDTEEIYWMDKNTGIIIRLEEYNEGKLFKVEECKYEINSVTEGLIDSKIDLFIEYENDKNNIKTNGERIAVR